MEVRYYQNEGRECILIGHAGHPEVEGTLGQYRKTSDTGGIYLVEKLADVAGLNPINSGFLAYVTQTTLSIDDTAQIIQALRDRFPDIHGPKREDICYATQNRQDAVKNLTRDCDLVLVVGSHNSSNSNRLVEISEKKGIPAYLIDSASDIREDWLQGKKNIGLSAGASAPEVLVNQVIDRLRVLTGGAALIESAGVEENVVFSLPRELARKPA